MKHYGIVGPGALGLLWAAKLAPAHRVSLWGRSGAVSATYGLISPETSTSTPPTPVVLGTLPGRAPDVMLVTTKSYDALDAVGHAMSQWTRPPQAILLFQNGIGSQEAIVSAYPALPVFAVTTTEGANRPAPAAASTPTMLVHAGRGLTRLGLLSAPHSACDCDAGHWLHAVAADFIAAGFETREEADIRAALWSKLLVNAGINAFTVLLELPNGGLLGHPQFEKYISNLSIELSRVAKAQGYPEPPDAIETRIRTIAEATRHNVSSMLQDYRAGRPTEIDHINGTISMSAKNRGIETPVNDMLWRAVVEKTARAR